MRAIVPIASATGPCTSYQLVASPSLPLIDCTVTVKNIVFSKHWLTRFNRFTILGRRWFGFAYWTGFSLCVVSLFMPPTPFGGWIVLICVPLQLIPTIVALLVLRYDMVIVLLESYEFWYMTFTNIIVCTLMGLSFDDSRWPLTIAVGCGFELAILIDANFRRTRAIVIGTAFGAALNMSYTISTAFQLVPARRNPTLLSYNGHTLCVDDVNTNILGTILIILLRNAYRKHTTTIKRTGTKRWVQCVTYRCRLALQPTTEWAMPRARPTLPNGPSRLWLCAARRSLIHETAAQLTYVGDGTPLEIMDVLVTRWPQWWSPRILPVCSTISLVSVLVTALSTNPTIRIHAARLALMTASVVFVGHAASTHRQLRHQLLTSFDFLFLSAQMTITHACIADMVQWKDPRALAVLASYLLTHSWLVLDAVLPVHKTTRLGYHSAIAAALILVVLTLQLVVMVVVVVADDLNSSLIRLRDREIFVLTLHGRTKSVRVVAVLFGRTLTTLSWTLRLLWRLWNGRPDDLLLLQGCVAFDCSHPAAPLT